MASLPSLVSEKPNLALSFDTESTSGESINSGAMVMLGVAAVLENQVIATNEQGKVLTEGWIVSRFECCLEETTSREEKCWETFWVKHQDVWAYITKNKVPPEFAMQKFSMWLEKLKQKYNIYFVAKPAAWDWQWLSTWYYRHCPEFFSDDEGITHERQYIGFKSEDINGYKEVAKVMGLFEEYTRFTKILPESPHYALDDAITQAAIFLKSREFFRNLKKKL